MTSDNENLDSQMIQCAECDEFYPARDDTDKLVPAGVKTGDRCTECGGDEFEPVVLDPDHKRD
jgi:hypothetical protein